MGGDGRTPAHGNGAGAGDWPRTASSATRTTSWCMVAGTRAHAEALRDEVAAVLAPMGLRLSEEKTRIVHIDEGFDFLGFRIQRQPKRGTGKRVRLHLPVQDGACVGQGQGAGDDPAGRRTSSLAVLLHRLNPVLRGWTNYFRHGVSKATFDYLRHFTWRRVVGWLRRKHRRANWKWLRRRYLPRWWPTDGDVALFDPATVAVTRYRYRGATSPRRGHDRRPPPDPTARTRGEPDALERARPVRRAGRGNGPAERPAPRPGPTQPRAAEREIRRRTNVVGIFPDRTA